MSKLSATVRLPELEMLSPTSAPSLPTEQLRVRFLQETVVLTVIEEPLPIVTLSSESGIPSLSDPEFKVQSEAICQLRVPVLAVKLACARARREGATRVKVSKVFRILSGELVRILIG